MKKITLIILFIGSILGANAQVQISRVINDSVAIGRPDGSSGTSLYGDIYLKNVTEGLMRINADRKIVPYTLTESDIPSLPISKVIDLSDSLAAKANKTFNNVASGAIAASKLVGTDINTVGTITTGTWNATAILDAYISSAATWNAKQAALSGTGIVKSTGGTISYLTDNSTNWNTAYTYSQVGHLPLSGGSVTGQTNIATSSGGLSIGTTMNNGTLTVGSDDATSELVSGGNNTNLAIRAMGVNGGVDFYSGGVSNGSKSTVSRLRVAPTGVYNYSLTGAGNVIAGADNTGLIKKIAIGSGLSLSGDTLTATGGSSGSVTTPGMTAGRVVVANSASDIGTTTALTISGSDLSISGSVTATDFVGAGTSLTGTAAGLTAGNVTTNANLTGDVTSLGNATTVGKINGVSLAGLATGILKNTTTTGVPSIAVAADFPTLNQNTTGTAAFATSFGGTTANTSSFGTDPAWLWGYDNTLATVKPFSASTIKTFLLLDNVSNTSDATKNSATATLTNKTISGSSNTLSNIGNSSLTNSSVTVNGTSVALGASATVTAAAGTLTGTTLNPTVVTSSLTSVGTLANLTVTNPITGSITGTAATATSFGGVTANTGSFGTDPAWLWGYDNTATTVKPFSLSTLKTFLAINNVDNTSDASKPVSTAQATAIAVVQSDINTHEADVSNPHSVTKTQVGLSNVDNTSDANKPVSTATQTALDLKANISSLATVATSGDYNDLSNKPSIPAYTTGLWTPTGNGVTFSSASGSYVTIGDMVFATYSVVMPATSNTNGFFVNGLPFAPATADLYGGNISTNNSGYNLNQLVGNASGGYIGFLDNTATATSNADMSARTIKGTVIYKK